MIGVDANQDWMGDGNKVVASMMKRVDTGCYTAIQQVHEGTFQGGILALGLEGGGVAISRFDDLLDFADFGIEVKAILPEQKPMIASEWASVRASVPTWIWKAIDELEAKIISGEVAVPKADTRDDILRVRELWAG
jgi:basic membrane protein A